MVGVSGDSVDVLKRFAAARKITFRLLSDEGSAIIKSYGIHHKKGLPHPGTFLIDKQGIVRAKLFRDGYRDRHANEELIAAARQLQ